MLLLDDSRDRTWQPVPLPDADVRYVASWLAADEADRLFRTLHDEILWERHRLKIFGRDVDAPRLSCWVGDADATYRYSQTRFEPQAWTQTLLSLRERVEQACAARFNSVLANLYRDGGDAMGWHSDNEPELGDQPLIASLSLGAPRRFRLRRRVLRGAPAASAGVSLMLPHGSLLIMAGPTQSNYQHDLPRMATVTEARINLTFRLIHTRAQART